MSHPIYVSYPIFGLHAHSEYGKIPKQLRDDNVIPAMSEIPNLFTSIRHPRRSRSVSVGPQSEADAYETLAYRQHCRRESKSEMNADTPGYKGKSSDGYFSITTSNSASRYPMANNLPTPAPSSLDLSQKILETDCALYTPLTPGTRDNSRRPSQERRENEKEEREIFAKVEVPRVRYDVEVITKLIVYSGTSSIQDSQAF